MRLFKLITVLLLFSITIVLVVCNRKTKRKIRNQLISEQIKLNEREVEIKWNDYLLAKYTLNDIFHFRVTSPYVINTMNRFHIGIKGSSKYLDKGKGLQKTPDIYYLEKYVNYRNKYIPTSVKNIKELILKTQVFMKPISGYDNRYDYKQLNNELKYGHFECFYHLEIAKAFNCLANNSKDFVSNYEYNSILKKMKNDNVIVAKSVLDKSISIFFNENNRYNKLLDSICNIKEAPNIMYVIPNLVHPPFPIFIFSIDSTRNGFILNKGVLNAEIFEMRTLYM